MEIELNFRLDEHGRTAPSNSESERPSAPDHPKDNPTTRLDYQSKTILTNLSTTAAQSSSPDDSPAHRQWLDDLLFDCQISDSGLMPRTFWVPAQGMTPRCHLEQMAWDIFHHHVPASLKCDVSCSGAEWWAQLRPSPDRTGRYAMHDDSPDELPQSGISFHWDKDEDLRLLMGGTTYIHPHLSTVTYLTDLGAPTLAINHRVNTLTGEWIAPDHDQSHMEGFVSWPLQGKHLSFDGRFLHAAPTDLMEPGAWEQQLQLPPVQGEQDDEDNKRQQEKLLKRRHRRVTFLVNIWLNYKPFDIKPFPETMIDKMSGGDESKRKRLEFLPVAQEVTDDDRGTTMVKSMTPSESTQPQHKTFTWPMGDCDSKEFIEAHMPLDAIRGQASKGGNLCIQWQPDVEKGYLGARLYTETTGIASAEAPEKRKLGDNATDTNDSAKRPKSHDITKTNLQI